MKRNKQWNVSKALALASLYHFLHSAAAACVVPFLTIYFRQLGLTAQFVGIIMGAKYFIFMLCTPFWSYCAGRHNKRRVLILGSLLSSVGAGLLFTLIPPIDKEIEYKFCNRSIYAKNGWNQNTRPEVKDHISDIKMNKFAHTILPTVVNGALTSHPSSTLQAEIEENLPGLTTVEASITNRINPLKQPHKTELSNITYLYVSTPENRGSTQTGDDNRQSKLNQFLQMKESGHVRTQGESAKHLSFKEDHKEKNSTLDVYSSSVNSGIMKRDVALETGSEDRLEKQHINTEPDHSFKILDNQHQTLVLILLAVALWEVLASALEWVADDGLYDYLDFVDSVDRYGKQWIWGYLGTAGAAFSIGILVDRLHCFINAYTSRIAVHFYGYAVLITLTLVVGVFYPIHTAKKNDMINRTVKGLHLLGGDGRAMLYVITVFITGAIRSTINNFLFWQMQNNGSSEAFMGIAVAIGFIAEVLLYLFKDKMLKILSFSGSVAFGLVCLTAQLLYYSFLWSSWAVLPIQILNAFSNGALWWAVWGQVNDLATPGIERTLHKIYHVLSFGLSASIGSVCSGFIVNSFGIERLYQACSAIAMVWLVVFLIAQSKIPRQKRVNYSQLLADTSDMSDSDDEQGKDWLITALKNDDFLQK
ncbi:major facilitator superfamily domain-containing protein 6-like [Rhincodon typus]|uniref:major facilitator superfamily domain-containing protein 6-like n=1 Tax=Rhincodon typus TaxID=259920 RepID=UPI00202F301D|nr:major facilitator superfamily domain-containing protein 6-like [Rhincodon typus]XP_020386983.2 major facilitator superfamily domain-containing protein 6-like [Rhincodon typus]XP_048466881.1 major facilitator superfamily domain-containing protein 6-like [Rhincodon typus]